MNRAQSYEAHDKINFLWLILKITYGLVFIIAGADKYFNLIVDWQKYVSPHILNLTKMNAHQFLQIWGAIEIVAGILVLTGLTRIGAYLCTLLLVLIIINLLSMQTYYDIAVRDAVMAVGSFVLAQLTEVRDEHLIGNM